MRPEEHVERPGSCGRVFDGNEILLLDENRQPVKQGEIGELFVKNSMLIDSYFRNKEATDESFYNGFLSVGDMAYVDEEGYYFIVDRKKDMVISGGFNIYPREIEDVLFEHPAVKGTAVVGVPHPKWGEEVVAVVCLHEGKTADEAELIAFVKERKGSLVAPKRVQFWDGIPLTNLGKVDKKEIRARLQAAQA